MSFRKLASECGESLHTPQDLQRLLVWEDVAEAMKQCRWSGHARLKVGCRPAGT